MTHFLLVALGGGVGRRHAPPGKSGRVAHARPGSPLGHAVREACRFGGHGILIGWLAGRSAGASNELRLFLATGFLGGFTTFSAFSLEFAVLWEEAQQSTRPYTFSAASS